MVSKSSFELELGEVRYFAESEATQFFWGRVPSLKLNDIALVSGRIRPTSPVRIFVSKGARPGDFLGNDLLLWVAREHITRIFQEGRFRGWGTFPVDVRLKGRKLGGYVGVTITGRAGPIDYRRSRVRWFENPDGSRGGIRAIDGLYFDPRNWDGSEIFAVDDAPSLPLMTPSVWQRLAKAKASNFRPRPLASFKFGQANLVATERK